MRARRVGTSPAAATPKAISTAAHSEKKSNALPSLRAAPVSGCPKAANTPLTLRAASDTKPSGAKELKWADYCFFAAKTPITVTNAGKEKGEALLLELN